MSVSVAKIALKISFENRAKIFSQNIFVAKFTKITFLDCAGEGIVLPDSYRAPLRPGAGGVPGMVRPIDASFNSSSIKLTSE